MSDQQEQPIPEVVCSGGFRLPKLSALVPSAEQLAELLARKADERGE